MGDKLTAAIVLGLALASANAARATTVTSDTIDGICNAVVTLYGAHTESGTVTLYQGALAQHTIALQVYPNQGNRVCYSRAVDPHNCTGAMTAPVCAPVTASPSDVVDIK